VTFQLPDTTHRVFIPGATGSGKTRFATWLLSRSRFDKIPFIIIDYKQEKLFTKIREIKPLTLKSSLPDKPGLYIVQPDPEDPAVEDWLYKVWRHESTGLYADEALMLPHKSAPFRGILTQGRSKEIPVIFLSQRPVDVSRYAVSQADYYAKFRLHDARDNDAIIGYMPKEARAPLPNYHCHWYDVGNGAHCVLGPCESDTILVDTIRQRLKELPNRRRFV